MRGTHFLRSTNGGSSQDTEKTESVRGAHKLESKEGGINQDMSVKISQGSKPQGCETKNLNHHNPMHKGGLTQYYIVNVFQQ